MKLIHCDRTYARPILEILNEAIVNSTALYDYKPRTMESMAVWFNVKENGGFPVIAAVTDSGELMGFGSYGTFRSFPAYKYSVEHSVYVATPFRGQRVGTALLHAIIKNAQTQGYHALIGAIDSNNAASVALHKKIGFQHAGTLRQVGFKFGRWLDLDFHQLILETPAKPVDG
jgi:L-amino acid N-acyltransferase